MELHRRKTETEGRWDLEVNGEIVGQAERWFISRTQPRWKLVATINGRGYVIENAYSVGKGLREIAAMVQADEAASVEAAGATDTAEAE